MRPDRRTLPIFGLILLVIAIGSTIANAQMPRAAPPPPLSYSIQQQLQDNPGALSQLPLPSAPMVPGSAPAASAAVISPWQPLTNSPGNILPSNPLLLTDGTVIVHDASQRDWWQLTPDITGSYVNGTWSQLGSLPAGYGPLYFGSAVLPDGRVIISGGEYNFNNAVFTNQGAIYYPLFGAWRSVPPPSGWANIGDGQTVVLADGTYMLANALTQQQALLNASNLTWTATGSGKADNNSEEGWTLLPSGDVLTVDVDACNLNTEQYLYTTGNWDTAGNTPNQLSNSNTPNLSNCSVIGPQVLRPDGTVIAFGAATGGVAHTAIFDTSTLTWTAGPNLPTINGQNYSLTQAPAALLPDGNVLFAASPGFQQPPVHFFEFDGESFTQVADTQDAPAIPPYYVNFLVLPTGQILATDFIQIEIYSPAGSANPSWAPVIDTYPATIVRGATYQLTGRQFNGLSQGAAFGNNVQGATNYPIIRIINAATNHVFYARTSSFNTMSVAPNTLSSTNFMATGSTETGFSHLFVVTNGIASQAVDVVIR